MKLTDALAKFPETLPGGWRKALALEAGREYFQALAAFVQKERRSETVYPAPENVFRALELVDLPDVRVVILGQDPYPGENQAIGLSFAVPNEMWPKPPSLMGM